MLTKLVFWRQSFVQTTWNFSIKKLFPSEKPRKKRFWAFVSIESFLLEAKKFYCQRKFKMYKLCLEFLRSRQNMASRGDQRMILDIFLANHPISTCFGLDQSFLSSLHLLKRNYWSLLGNVNFIIGNENRKFCLNSFNPWTQNYD